MTRRPAHVHVKRVRSDWRAPGFSLGRSADRLHPISSSWQIVGTRTRLYFMAFGFTRALCNLLFYCCHSCVRSCLFPGHLVLIWLWFGLCHWLFRLECSLCHVLISKLIFEYLSFFIKRSKLSDFRFKHVLRWTLDFQPNVTFFTVFWHFHQIITSSSSDF